MKILNAKGLMRFGTSGGFPDKEGYMLKRGDLNKGFQRRWFVLRGNLLFYYEKRGDKEPTGVVVLEGCAIEVAECEHVDNYAFQINFPGSGLRSYILSADSQEDMESWMKALSCAPYDYIKLLVAELDNQLRETVTTDNVRLVQKADRESRLFSHTYSTDSDVGQPHRSTLPTLVDVSEDPDLLTDSFDAVHETAKSCDRFEDPYAFDPIGTFGEGMPSVSMSVVTWQKLGITNFFEMHDEMRREIREFSASRDQSCDPPFAGVL